MKSLGIVLGFLMLVVVGGVVLSLLGMAVGVISLPFHAANNGIETAHDIIDDTINADNAIYNYEWFKQQHEDILAIQKKITVAENSVLSFESALGSDRSTWTFEDKTEWARLRSVAQGLRSQYEQMIADYNARSKMANRSIFEDGLIPNVIEGAASLIQ